MRRLAARDERRAAPSARRAVAPPLAEPRHAIAIGLATDACWRGRRALCATHCASVPGGGITSAAGLPGWSSSLCCHQSKRCRRRSEPRTAAARQTGRRVSPPRLSSFRERAGA
ncbi:hypothetical protein EMIHUDRAFT_446279 [Emiliania huxleyi CCMP1516]|uniref:Uncharacterized protein n=2 Tax=Emiliania huxleyi TaxID=2903 RepID=A0A0D3IEI9_EMIH1|nr:hypothetical protein EMIHUDRAFT_446279 [Emiliania huxleyi CCMP1516]EOD09674.1 hypothetical protein EMIHUDRAFT_446279 [Emiliania huxleyi CCMP1516]|eukprot:XP_005762103.1 hypothetical protein EMIHUDRAFT_446279 [Emiliania huxleyi CCMP1516]